MTKRRTLREMNSLIFYQPKAYKSRSLFHFLASKDGKDVPDYTGVQEMLIHPAPLKSLDDDGKNKDKDTIIHFVV